MRHGFSNGRRSALISALAVAVAVGACAAQTTTVTVTTLPAPGVAGPIGESNAPAPVATAAPASGGVGNAGVEPSTPATSPAPTSVVTPLRGWEAVDRYLEIAIVRDASQAASVAVMRDGVLEHVAAYGSSDEALTVPVTPTERFRIASISKTVAAVTVLRLVQDGTLLLDAPIGASLASGLGVGTPAEGVADVTLRHLLTHRSGFGQYEDLFFRNQVGSCPEAAAVGLARPMAGLPGTTYRYSNLNFCLVELVVEAATGRSFVDVVEDELLQPLGIEGMRMAGTFDVRSGDVAHRSDAGRNYMEVLGGAGAWVASPAEIVTIIDSLDPTTDGWKPLEPQVLAEMMTITTDPPDPTASTTTVLPVLPPVTGYGMGVMIFGPGEYGHTGTLESTHAMAVRRADGLTWAITVSGEHPASSRQLARMMDNALVFAGLATGEIVPVATAVPPAAP